MTASLLLALLIQSPPPTPIDWSADDSARIAFSTSHGKAYRASGLVLWAPKDSLDARWLPVFVDSLARAMGRLRALIGGPYPWQRIGTRPVVFHLSPGRFVSHASGMDAVFLSLNSVRQGYSPFIHEAAHELLIPAPPFFPFEYPDTLVGDSAAAKFPFWLSEGLPDYLAETVSAETGFRAGDVFQIGGLAQSDSTCAARLAASPRREEILARVGDQGRLEALFTTDRAQVAPVYYACSQSFTRHVVGRIGLKAAVGLFPVIPSGAWLAELERAAGDSLPAIRRAWMAAILGM